MSNPKHTDAHELRTRVCELKDRGDPRALASYLISTLASGGLPSTLHAKAYNELGLAHLQLDEPLEAEKAFLSAIESDPQALNPRFNRANLALYAQKYDDALGWYRKVLAVDPNHAGALHHAGLCLATTGRPAEALNYLEAAANVAPDAMGPTFWMGETLVALERFADALPWFRRAATIMPDHRESQRGIAICLFADGRYDQCIEQCDALVQSGGGSEYLALRIKGDALIEIGEPEGAALHHLALTEMDFDARDYIVMRATALAAERPDDVDRYIGVVVDAIPELEGSFRLALAARLNGARLGGDDDRASQHAN